MSRKMLYGFCFYASLAAGAPVFAAGGSVMVNVPGTSDLWLAGMPDGSTAGAGPNLDPGSDVATAESPAQVAGLPVGGGSAFAFSVTGKVSHGTDPNTEPLYGPEGEPDINGGGFSLVNRPFGPDNGIANITVEMDALIGVFLDDNQPSSFAFPAALNFGTSVSRNFLTLSPLLRQPFYIGDGMTDGGTVQQFIAPAGATRLYLGPMDVYKWLNNPGSFSVTVTSVPEPTGLGIVGLAALACVRGRRRVEARRQQCAN